MSASPYFFLANLLWLDLVNTEPVRDGVRMDLLDGFAGLVGWLREGGALSGEEARRVLERWDGTAEGAAALASAKTLRAALRTGAERMAAGRDPGAAMLREVNRVLADRPARLRVLRQGSAFATRLEPVTESALQLLAPVAESAAWLLEHGDRSLVRQCDDPRCVLYFYDTTKNRSRRWCSMEGCGSRAKAGAYYRRWRGAR